MNALAAFDRSATRELGYLRRHPWDLAVATWVPWLLLIMLAWMMASGVPRGLPIAVVNDDRTAMSREYVRLLDAAPAIDVAAHPSNLSEAWSLVRSMRVYALVYIPADTARDTERGGQATVFAYYNASFRTAGQAAFTDITAATQALGARLPTPAVAPVRVQSTLLFNPERSYEHYLVGLLHPAILHLALCICVIAALGRELRDGSAGKWLGESAGRLASAVAGKIAPYMLMFTLYGMVSLVWLAAVRGGGAAGNVAVLVAGELLLYLAYAAIGLLLVGLTKNMGQALSLSGLYAGTSLAFADGTFPLDGASLFTRIWSKLLPYSSYLEVKHQQLDMGSPILASVGPLAILVAFGIVAGAGGLLLYGRAARDPAAWGRR